MKETRTTVRSDRPIIAVAQTSPRLADVDGNLRQAEAIVASLAGTADLVVFPELFTTGYSLEHLDLLGLAEPIPDGPSLRRLKRAAAGAGVAVVGSIIERDAGELFDTAMVIDRHGEVVGRYRKSHLYPAELDHFKPGAELAVVVVDGLHLGLAICFEHAFPEIFAELALAGAQVVAVPSAVPRGFGYLLDLRTRARAQDNQFFVAASNLAGDDGHTSWCGGSLIVDPRGSVLASAGASGEALIAAELDLSLIDRERAQEPIWANRRPELYRTLRAGLVVPPRSADPSGDGHEQPPGWAKLSMAADAAGVGTPGVGRPVGRVDISARQPMGPGVGDADEDPTAAGNG
jgi:predicted amidohydrolase